MVPLLVNTSNRAVASPIHARRRKGRLHSNVYCSAKKASFSSELSHSIHAMAILRSKACKALDFAPADERGEERSSKASWMLSLFAISVGSKAIVGSDFDSKRVVVAVSCVKGEARMRFEIGRAHV